MNLAEVEQLLDDISSLDRRPFPDGAAEVWLELLRGTSYEDAHQAVLAYYATPVDSVKGLPALLPGQLKALSARMREQRARDAVRKAGALPEAPPRPAAQTRSAAFLAAREAIRQANERAVERYRAENPDELPYRHRETLLTQVA